MTTPALIVGGGPAGAATAIGLARAGLAHLLVERSRDTGDALCGGFLSWRTLDRLAALGIEADALNRDRLTTVRLFAGNRTATAALPRPALAVSRRRLDTLLLARALAVGASVERGVTVRTIEGTQARTADGATLSADTMFLASGKHDVRGLARPAQARGSDPTLGLRLRLPPSAALTKLLAGAIELHLFPGGYAGLCLQEDGAANLCMAVHRSRLDLAGSPTALIARLGEELPALGERLGLADLGVPIDAIANVPYGWRADTAPPGIVRLGDQAGVIPSLAGEGMGIAIASGMAASHAYAAGGAAAMTRWQPRFARRLARPLTVAGLVRRVAESRVAAPALLAARPSLIDALARLTRVGG
ncbi:NAD(P)/FAD-dependent oxidoreductase [Sphingomonas sp.]|uniref:NAD(P)/FAD-dependent oxidoreductase n=1 Tax=Sphingomonas sp. TaxID=28214 RepID=UPI002D809B7E|nr:FAD-dependent monooxygenase [Sphingomonas sp.]HEU0045492.1 FAD-dependent monooxygenase [Sphingomonas sp.]